MQASKILEDNVQAGKRLDSGLPLAQRDKFVRHLGYAETHDSRLQRFERIRAEERAVLELVKVKGEPRVYAKGSGNSYFLDLARSVQPSARDHEEAKRRLRRHALEVSVESNLGSAEGLRARRSAATHRRPATSGEVRALTTATNSGGAFVTPLYVVEDWAAYRTYGPAFVEQTQKLEDPGYGMQLNLPSFTSSVSVAQQTEGSTVANSSPSGAYVTSALVPFAGEIDISQQLYDRAGPENIDTVIYSQLAEELHTAVDSYALTQALSTAGSVTGASVWSNAGFFGDLAKAGANMLTSAGTVLPPTHAFMQPTFYRWLLGQTDNSGRPLVVPAPVYDVLPVQNGPDGEVPPGFNGERILDSAVFVDGNIGNSGSNSQIILANASNCFTLMSEPATRAVPETFAGSLEVALQLYCYFGIVVRHSAAVQVISGAGYPASPSFA